MEPLTIRRQAGIALPVMLIMLVVMLVSSIYLFKSSNSSTMMASNMAYDSTLSKAVDFGLHQGFQWISDRARLNKAALLNNDSANGYLATLDTTQSANDAGFWIGAKVVTQGADQVEYVVHRACAVAGPYDTLGNACVQTAANPSGDGGTVAAGDSLDAGGVIYNSAPQIHYVITARIFGKRGGNVVNQMVVLIDA